MQSKNSFEVPQTPMVPEEQSHSPKKALSSENQMGQGLESDQSLNKANFQEGLRQKLTRLKQFIGELGQEKQTPIGVELLDQLEIDEEVYRNVGPEIVIQETEKRIEKMAKTHKLKRNWSICDLKILIWLICKHCQRDGVPVADIHDRMDSWRFISSLIPGTTADSCLFKWLSLKRHKITLHGWSEVEEDILIKLQKKYAQSRNKWNSISKELYILNKETQKIYRHPKQCREHYNSFLDPEIKKGPWSLQEDLTLLAHIVQNNGQKKWCKLVKILEGRTENAIKNRFQLIFVKLKKKKENKSKGEFELIQDYIKQNGGQVPIIKKQREQAVKNESPPHSFQSLSQISEPIKAEEPPIKFPIIPTFTFFSSSRSLPSAFVPYLQEPLYQQLPDSVYIELAGKKMGSKVSIQEEQIRQNP